jgi:hypothetical protein
MKGAKQHKKAHQEILKETAAKLIHLDFVECFTFCIHPSSGIEDPSSPAASQSKMRRFISG